MPKAWNMICEQQQREEKEEKSGINLCMHSAPSSSAAQTETAEQQQQQQQRRKDGEKLSFSGSSPRATKILGTRLGKRTCKSRKGGRGMKGKGDPREGGKKVLLLATEEPREGNKSWALGGGEEERRGIFPADPSSSFVVVVVVVYKLYIHTTLSNGREGGGSLGSVLC